MSHEHMHMWRTPTRVVNSLALLEEGIMKLAITGASHFVNRMFEACGQYQWAREVLKNSLEAGATQVEFGIEWQAVGKLGVYRRYIADNGCGMDAEELKTFFSTLGEGAGKIGGIHDNFGVGAKIALLPWNPEGIVVISYKDSRASMIWIVHDPESGDYELVEFKLGDKKKCVVDPNDFEEIEGIDWSQVRPKWLDENGTIIVLIGSEEYPDTVLGNPDAGEADIKGLSVYLNTRFWNLDGVDVHVLELRTTHKSRWPLSEDDRDDKRRPNNRKILGAEHYVTTIETEKGKLSASGIAYLDDERVTVEWYLWEGDRPAIHSYAKKGGYIAVRYKGELFHLTSHKATFRWFGIVESEVQQNLTVVLEPQLYVPGTALWGIHPDQSRNRLIFTGNGQKGVDIPLVDWGAEFAQGMPQQVLDAIHRARGGRSGIIDEEYRKRLQDKFGERWKKKILVSAKKASDTVAATESQDEDEAIVDRGDGTSAHGKRKRRSVKSVRRKASLGGPADAVEVETPVDVPRYVLANAEEFERAWHLAMWAPNDPDGPTVFVNVDSPILQEIVEFHQKQYPEVLAEDVAEIVRDVFGEIAACKIAHSQKLTRNIPEEELDEDYRNESALTISLMGLMAEESVISQRLGKLGRKLSSHASEAESVAVAAEM